MFENKLVLELLERYRVLWALGHASSLMGWDSETYMPREGVEERSIASAELSLLSRRLLLENIAPLVEKLVGVEGLNDFERGVVRVLWRDVERLRRIPENIQYELAKLRSEAPVVWREAREKDDFERFKPYLSRIVELERQVAELLGYEEHPYDALLDYYEEGLRDRDVRVMFSTLVPSIRRVLEKVMAEGYYPREHVLENVEYRREAMETVNREVLNILGFPWSRGRLDVSAHPFTIGIALSDVRITTRYEGRDFRRSLFAVIHEFGHALYDLQVDERLKMTPLAEGASLGVHESQSRFWENIVGRSRAFVKLLKPVLDEHLGFTRDYSVEELYKYFNIVRPSLIRVDADEVTYNLHIYLRYELERMLVAGEIKVHDLPELWNEYMDRLLGIKPKSYKDGVLQDIHWSLTAIGYFPTYTIGNILAAQLKNRFEADVGRLGDVIGERRFELVRVYLREKIHKWGAVYPPKDLVVKALGEPMNPVYLAEYIENKYSRL
ncbi:MAG: carboxypeptidase M32 [Acidilobaceae archaeon]